MAGSDRIARWAAWWDTRRRTYDVVSAAVLGGAALMGLASADVSGSERTPDVFAVLLVLGMATAFAFRRVAPLRSFSVVIALTIVFWVTDYATNFDGFSLFATYSAVLNGGADRRRVWGTVGAGVTVLTVVALVGVLTPDEDLPALAVVGIAAIHITAAVAGEILFERRARVAELQERADRLEAERELLARQAVLDERARIARDMHDIVAHSMSVMVVQAGAAQRMVTQRPDQAVQALEHVQATGREALTEMRRMLGLLRDSPGGEPIALGPQPTTSDLDELVRHAVGAGVDAELTVEGPRPDGAPTAEMTAYRIVQEALTNVIKHAGRPVRASVRVTYLPDCLRVEVDDDGRGTSTGELERSTGHGLVGMRERVDLFGGSLRAGPRHGGGFRVAATIPLAGRAAAVGVVGGAA